MNSREIAQTILSQLGGPMFKMMTGAKDFVALDAGLMFGLPGGGGFCKDGINKVRIELVNDLYNVKFYRVRKMAATLVASQEQVYCDDLKKTVSKYTGLALSIR